MAKQNSQRNAAPQRLSRQNKTVSRPRHPPAPPPLAGVTHAVYARALMMRCREPVTVAAANSGATYPLVYVSSKAPQGVGSRVSTHARFNPRSFQPTLDTQGGEGELREAVCVFDVYVYRR